MHDKRLRDHGWSGAALLGATMLVASVLVWSAPRALAATRFVDCDDGGDLQAIIDAADPGDAVIASGTCEGQFKVDKDLSILGFFSVTLDGSGVSNAFPVLLIDGGAHLVLENAVVTGGLASFPSHSAGIDVWRGSLEMRNSSVHGNNSDSGGGVLVFSGASAVIEDSEIHDNVSQGLGGGLFNNGTATVRDTSIEDNVSVRATGAGIFNGGSMTLVDSTVSGNRTSFNAGGIANSGPASLLRVTVSANSGGMSNDDDDLTIRDSAIVDKARLGDQTSRAKPRNPARAQPPAPDRRVRATASSAMRASFSACSADMSAPQRTTRLILARASGLHSII